MSATTNNSDTLFVSLGERCQTAYQTIRFTKKDSALFFDWLITPSDSYKSLNGNEEDFFRPNNWKIVDVDDLGGIRLFDRGTGLGFQHEFPVIAPGSEIIARSLVEGHLKNAKSKFTYLKRKTIKAIQETDSVYLIRHETIETLDQAMGRIEDIKSRFLHLNPKIKVMLASPAIEREKFSDDFFIVKINEGAQWTGDDASWDRLFNLVISSQI